MKLHANNNIVDWMVGLCEANLTDLQKLNEKVEKELIKEYIYKSIGVEKF